MINATGSVCAEKSDSQKVLARLSDRIGPQKFNAWFRNGARLDIEDGLVRVWVPNPFVANWIEAHYLDEIARAAADRTDKDLKIVVAVDPSLAGQLRKGQLDTQAQLVSRATHGQARTRRHTPPQELRYDLEEFIVGAGNRLAYSAAQLMAGENPPFNPLFIHGLCGVGKTHLLQGVCNLAEKLSHKGKPRRWRYVSGEQFTNEFIQALRYKKIDEFRSRYRKLDLLAVDDVHFLAAKKATQDEFLHTFNAIESAGKHIIMASDAAPRMVSDLNEQLVSRFAAGMVVRIDPPDQATRLEILRRKSSMLRVRVNDQAMEYLASHVHGSVRELEGALIKLAALAALENSEVTAELAATVMADHLARTDSALTLGDIEAVVSTYFGITPADLHSSRRTKTVSVARMVAMYLARRNTQMSYPEIGQAMGKNHSSVILAVQRMERLIQTNAQIVWMSPTGKKSMPADKLAGMIGEQIR